jgi:hypothetical protein
LKRAGREFDDLDLILCILTSVVECIEGDFNRRQLYSDLDGSNCLLSALVLVDIWAMRPRTLHHIHVTPADLSFRSDSTKATSSTPYRSTVEDADDRFTENQGDKLYGGYLAEIMEESVDKAFEKSEIKISRKAE